MGYPIQASCHGRLWSDWFGMNLISTFRCSLGELDLIYLEGRVPTVGVGDWNEKVGEDLIIEWCGNMGPG
jgi:hypothetical protein